MIWTTVVIIAFIALGATVQAAGGTIRGYAFLDKNRNGVKEGDEPGLEGVLVTIKYQDYQQTYWTGDGDPSGDVPGPGSYGPTPLQPGYWTVIVHVPDGYRSTSPTELQVSVPESGAATGVNFGLYGSGPISYSAGTGVAMGGGAGTLPRTGGARALPTGQLVALLGAVIGFVILAGTPWCVAQAKQAYQRWW
jgi:hypothetical protein